MNKEYQYYWFSYNQYISVERPYNTYVDGNLFTEVTNTPKPFGRWSDYRLIAEGKNGRVTTKENRNCMRSRTGIHIFINKVK